MRLTAVQSVLENPEVYSIENVKGLNPDVDIITPEDLIDGGGDLNLLASAEILKVSSGSANDTSNGTGARTVEVSGLNANYVEVSEVVTLNGVSAVATINSFLRVFSVKVKSVGSGGSNAGVISVKDNANSVTLATVRVGLNRSYHGAFTIPAGYYGYIGSAHVVLDYPVSIMIRDANGYWDTADTFYQTVTDPTLFIQLAPKSDIKLRALTVGSDASEVEAGVQIILKKI